MNGDMGYPLRFPICVPLVGFVLFLSPRSARDTRNNCAVVCGRQLLLITPPPWLFSLLLVVFVQRECLPERRVLQYAPFSIPISCRCVSVRVCNRRHATSNPLFILVVLFTLILHLPPLSLPFSFAFFPRYHGTPSCVSEVCVRGQGGADGRRSCRGRCGRWRGA